MDMFWWSVSPREDETEKSREKTVEKVNEQIMGCTYVLAQREAQREKAVKEFKEIYAKILEVELVQHLFKFMSIS